MIRNWRETSDATEHDRLLRDDQRLANYEQNYREVMDGAAAMLAYWKLRDKFMGSRKKLYICAGVAALGILGFAYVSSSGTEASATLTKGTQLTINLGRVGGDLVENPVVQRIGERIEPFESGRTDRLEKQLDSKICESNAVKSVIEKAKDKQMRLLVVIGSADKFELADPLKNIYGSNNGLARVGQIRFSAVFRRALQAKYQSRRFGDRVCTVVPHRASILDPIEAPPFTASGEVTPEF